MSNANHETVYETLGRHPIHPFPARMAPGIALKALGESDEPLRVLDPMMGSGTVLAVARSRGHRAFGTDTDPLAVLLSRVWTTAVRAEGVRAKAAEVLSRARAGFGAMSAGNAYPDHADEETRSFLRYWFDEYARRQLAALALSIGRVRDEPARDVLWCGFSRLIITKQAGASLAMDLSHSRPHKVFERAPTKPFNKFLDAVGAVIDNCPQVGQERLGPPTVTRSGDARALPFRDKSFDLVLTSPPYLNAIDYMRCSKFTLVWMGHQIADLREVRSSSIGTEAASARADEAAEIREVVDGLRLTPKLNQRKDSLLCQYVFDMRGAIREVARVLAKNGRGVFVVGDSTVRGTFIRNSSVVAALAETAGLTLTNRSTRSLPQNRRYLPPPSANESDTSLARRMRRESVLTFQKR